MPRANTPSRSFDDLTVGELRRLLFAGLDESLSLTDALTVLHDSDQAVAVHEADTREFEAYRARREARHAAALSDAAAASDKAHRGQHDGARMAARQEARLEADELFARRSPLLDFQEWVELDRPEVHEVEVGVFRRAVEAMTELVR